MHRQTAHLFAERRQPGGPADQTEAGEQRQRGVERLLARPLEPLERARVAAPCDHIERRARQIDPVDLRLPVRTQPIARVPEAPDEARRQPAGTAGALVGGVLRDALGLEAVDAALGVVSRDLLQTGVDHRRDARHRERRLGDVGRDDDATAGRRPQRQILLVRVERSMKRNDLHAAPGLLLQLADGAADLRRARQEAQHLPVGRAEQIDRRLGHRLSRVIGDVDRMRTARRRRSPDSRRETTTPARTRASPT